MAKTNSSKKVVGYVRVSTGEQTIEGISLEAQQTRIHVYCSMRGLELAEMVVDAGVSGGKHLVAREGGGRVLELLHLGLAGGVVAVKLDRLFRNASDCLLTVEAWDRQGVGLHFVDMGGASIDTTTSTGKLFLTMLSGFAEFERAVIGERTSAVLQHKKAIGERTGGAIAYGYALAKNKVNVVKDPKEQVVIRRVRMLKLSGLSLRKIAAYLQREGYLARNGKPFQAQQIANMLAGSPVVVEAPKPSPVEVPALELPQVAKASKSEACKRCVKYKHPIAQCEAIGCGLLELELSQEVANVEVTLEPSVCLIGCGKSKAQSILEARDLYTSPLFKKSLVYVEAHFDQVYVISAEHGLIGLRDYVKSYNKEISSLPIDDRMVWGKGVVAKIPRPFGNVTILAGVDYVTFIHAALVMVGCPVLSCSLVGLQIGERLRWLNTQNEETPDAL